MPKFPDAKIYFDDPNSHIHIRYDDCLMTIHEFIAEMREKGLEMKFIMEYIGTLPKEQI